MGPIFVVGCQRTRVEMVSDRQMLAVKGDLTAKGHIVLMLTSKTKVWQVDSRDEDTLEPRSTVLGGKYDTPAKKP